MHNIMKKRSALYRKVLFDYANQIIDTYVEEIVCLIAVYL